MHAADTPVLLHPGEAGDDEDVEWWSSVLEGCVELCTRAAHAGPPPLPADLTMP